MIFWSASRGKSINVESGTSRAEEGARSITMADGNVPVIRGAGPDNGLTVPGEEHARFL